MQRVIVTTLTETELYQMINSAVRQALDDFTANLQPVTKDEPKLIDENELAERLGKSKVTIWKYRNEGKIPFKRIGKRILYNWQDVYDALHSVEQTEGSILK